MIPTPRPISCASSQLVDPLSPPQFNRRVVCIADDARLAATISSLIGTEGEYLAVLPGPRMDRPDGKNEVARCCNALVKVSAAIAVLAGIDTRAERAIRKVLTGRSVIWS